MHSKAKLKHMKQYANFQKNGKTSVEVVSEKVAHSNFPDETFLHRELRPNDG
jgi:ketopantoate hydroxymethyltransferase